MRKYRHYLAEAPSLRAAPARSTSFATCRHRGVVQGVVSNSDRLIVDANLRAVGIQIAGLKTVSRNDVRDGKPSPEPFLRAAWLTGIDPADAFVMEDSFTGAHGGPCRRDEDDLLAGEADGRLRPARSSPTARPRSGSCSGLA